MSEPRYLWDQQKCRGDKEHGYFNWQSLEYLTGIYYKQITGNLVIVNANRNGDKNTGFHLTYDNNYEKAHLTCQMPNGTKAHISAKSPAEQISSWYRNCCDQGQEPDMFMDDFIRYGKTNYKLIEEN